MPLDTWWKRGAVYQIYPRSFQDTNGDGIGDLAGIRRRLGHLVDLGVEALWLSPVYPSPMADFGYDVEDYRAIAPVFGTMADFDALLADAHARGLKVILDFVPNHTAITHPWFAQSRSSRTDPKRGWYIWRDGRDGGPPNNWISNFGGPAWTFDETTGQWYHHAFLPEQPDLDWSHPEVREAMHDVLRFWLDKGVDGFRVDVIWHLAKDPLFRDNPLNPAYEPGQPDIARTLQVFSADQPEIHDIVAGLRRVVDEYAGRVLIGEIYLPLERLVAYYGEDLGGAHLPFNFQLLQAPWDARSLARLIEEYEAALPAGGWPNWVLGNHDQPRIAGRLGEAQARIAMMMLLTLRGTPTLYYGDELGIGRVVIPRGAAHDPWERNEPGHGRDAQRTPMAWTPARHGGFTTGEPWLPLHEDAQTRNVATQGTDPGSMLSLTRALLALRRSLPALAVGSSHPVTAEGAVLAYERRHGGERLLTALNLAGTPASLHLSAPGRIVLTSAGPAGRTGPVSGELSLAPDEGVIVALAEG